MIWKIFKINWNTISKTTPDYQIWLTLVNWRKVNTSSEQTNITGWMGIRISPTYARDRLITIEWLILSDTRVWLSKGMDYLDNLFALQGVYWSVNYLNFWITDEQSREWDIKVAIKNALEYEINDDDYLDWSNRIFRISLIASDPRLFSVIENLVEWVESNYWWFKLWLNLGVTMSEWINEITCIATWNIPTPIRFEITASKTINKPLKILNTITNEFIEIDEDFISWDKLIIDTLKYTIEKNWISIKNKKVIWSSWLQIKDTTKFGIFDKDWWLSSNDLSVKIYFNNVLL